VVTLITSIFLTCSIIQNSLETGKQKVSTSNRRCFPTPILFFIQSASWKSQIAQSHLRKHNREGQTRPLAKQGWWHGIQERLLFIRAGFEPQSSCSLPPEWLGFTGVSCQRSAVKPILNGGSLGLYTCSFNLLMPTPSSTHDRTQSSFKKKD
jgi:hypothetical protein